MGTTEEMTERERAMAELARWIMDRGWQDTYAGVIVADAWEYARSKGARLEEIHGGAIHLGPKLSLIAHYLSPLEVIQRVADMTGYKWWVGVDGVPRFMVSPF